MFEETNQAAGAELEELPESLFDDDEVEEETETSEVETEKEEETNNTESEDKDSDKGENHAEAGEGASSTIRVKFNGEEKDISLDEARTLAQKGLNYDHVAAERDRNRVAFDFLKERAKSEGITVEQLIEKEREKTENQRLEAKMSEIRARDDDASEDTVKTLARLELDAEKAQKERESARAQEDERKARIEAWNKFFDEHPEFMKRDGGKQLTQEVFDLVDHNGLSPIEAYYTVRNKELEEKNRELEQQNKVMKDSQAAKKKSVGSMSGDRVGDDEDEFLAGFNSN